MRQHIFWYTKGLEKASSFRARVNRIEDKKELKEEIEKFFTHKDSKNA